MEYGRFLIGLGSNRSLTTEGGEMVHGFTSKQVTRAAEGRIRSEPGNRTLPLIISATMQPTDHTSTAAQRGDDAGVEGGGGMQNADDDGKGKKERYKKNTQNTT